MLVFIANIDRECFLLRLLEKQKDFSLYRVVLLKKGLKWFTDVCREFRYNVRDFEYRDSQTQAANADEMKKLKKEEGDKKVFPTFCIFMFFFVMRSGWLCFVPILSQTPWSNGCISKWSGAL